MPFLRSFAPWFAYGAVSSVFDWRVAAAVAMVVAIRSISDQRRQFGTVDDLTRTTALYFLGLTAVSVLDPTSPLHLYTPAMSLAALGLASAISLVRREPFTLAFAKRSVPRELWDEPAFFDANVTITAVWTASFLTTAAVCAVTLAVAPSATPVWIAAEVLGFVIPMRFTTVYRQRARARFAAA